MINNIQPINSLDNNSYQSLYQDFTKVTKEVAERFVLNFKSQPISISYDRETHKKIIYTQTEISLKYDTNKWDSKFIVCGSVNSLTVIDLDDLSTEACKTMLPILFNEATLFIKTKHGFHFYFFYNEKLISRCGGSLGYDILNSDSKNAIAPNSFYVDADDELITYELFVHQDYLENVGAIAEMSDELTNLINSYEIPPKKKKNVVPLPKLFFPNDNIQETIQPIKLEPTPISSVTATVNTTNNYKIKVINLIDKISPEY